MEQADKPPLPKKDSPIKHLILPNMPVPYAPKKVLGFHEFDYITPYLETRNDFAAEIREGGRPLVTTLSFAGSGRNNQDNLVVKYDSPYPQEARVIIADGGGEDRSGSDASTVATQNRKVFSTLSTNIANTLTVANRQVCKLNQERGTEIPVTAVAGLVMNMGSERVFEYAWNGNNYVGLVSLQDGQEVSIHRLNQEMTDDSGNQTGRLGISADLKEGIDYLKTPVQTHKPITNQDYLLFASKGVIPHIDSLKKLLGYYYSGTYPLKLVREELRWRNKSLKDSDDVTIVLVAL